MSDKVLERIREREQRKIRPEPVKPPKRSRRPEAVIEEPTPPEPTETVTDEADG